MNKKNNKRFMENHSEVKNINEAPSAEQLVLQEKANEMIAILDKEPRAKLVPFLRYTEYGTIPDVRLQIVKTENKDDTNTGDEVTGGEDSPASEGEPASNEPATTQG